MRGEIGNGPVKERLQGTSPVRVAKRFVLATRPMFFTAAVLPVLFGTAWGMRVSGTLDVLAAALALAATVLVHAGANVINDVCDDLNGTDPINSERIYPFTGGSRYIQADLLSRAAMRRWGLALLALAAALGLVLALLKGPVVLVLGVAGIAVGVAYSVAPIQLSGRGLGELAVAVGFGVLPVAGAAWLQGAPVGARTLLLSLPLSLWVFNILLINELPDRAADAAAGKRTLPVRWGVRGAAILYAATNALAVAAVGIAVQGGLLASTALLLPVGLLAAAVTITVLLIRRPPARGNLALAIKATLTIHAAGGLWLTAFAWP